MSSKRDRNDPDNEEMPVAEPSTFSDSEKRARYDLHHPTPSLVLGGAAPLQQWNQQQPYYHQHSNHHQPFSHPSGGRDIPDFAHQPPPPPMHYYPAPGPSSRPYTVPMYQAPLPMRYSFPSSQSPRLQKTQVFSEHSSQEMIHEGLRNGTIFIGKLRVNNKKIDEAYVTVPGLGRDVLISGHVYRNRALDGETVAVALFSSGRADFNPANRTGKVVAIIESKYDQVRVGRLLPFSSNPLILNFVPLDSRCPRMIINTSSNVPADVIDRRCKAAQFAQFGQRQAAAHSVVGDANKELFCFTIHSWPAHSKLPIGSFSSYLGEAGSFEVDTRAILVQHGLDREAFSPEALADIAQFEPKALEDGTIQPWTIPEDERAKRLDLTHLPIITIDPATARDLDDALSIEPAEPFNGQPVYRIGVHIADVSYFVRPGTALDSEARQRSSTVYMPHRAYPMLPELLSTDLCSLNPGVERLAFSTFWYMTEDGLVLSAEDDEEEDDDDDRYKPLFVRSIIKNMAQLSYDSAQEIIEGVITKENALEKLPSLSHQEVAEQVISNIVLMNKIAVLRRKWRFNHGAMHMTRGKKLLFAFDGQDPIGVQVYPIQDSNQMVEEYMLLSNELVARHLASVAPECALLRKHDPPFSHKLEILSETLFGRVGLPPPLTGPLFTRYNFYKHVMDLMAFVKKQGAAAKAASKAGSEYEAEEDNDDDDDDEEEDDDSTVLSEICASTIMFLATANMQPAVYKAPYTLPSSSDDFTPLPLYDEQEGGEEEDVARLQADIDRIQSESESVGEAEEEEEEEEARKDSESYRHYALAMDLYTHFTSPIRRYPDLVVHRVLAWTLDRHVSSSDSSSPSYASSPHDHDDSSSFEPVSVDPQSDPLSDAPSEDSTSVLYANLAPDWILQEATVANPLHVPGGITQVMERMCRHFNYVKSASRRAQEQAEILFLCKLLKQQCSIPGSRGYVTDDAVVVGVGGDFLKVVLQRYAVEAEVRWTDHYPGRMLRRGAYDWNQGIVHVHWNRDYLSSSSAGSFTKQDLHRLMVLGTRSRKEATTLNGVDIGIDSFAALLQLLPVPEEIDVEYRIFDRIPVRIVVDDSDIPMKLHVTLDVPQRGGCIMSSFSAADALAPQSTLPADLSVSSFKLAAVEVSSTITQSECNKL